MRLPLILATLLLSGGIAGAADVTFPKGSSFGLVPPVGMVESNTFAGFEDPTIGAAILMVEMPAVAYSQVEAGFTDAALASKGITVDARGTLPLALPDAKTLFVTGKQHVGTVSARKWILLAGTSQATVLVTIQVADENAGKLTDETVRKTLETLAYRTPPTPQEQMAELPFRFTDMAGFRPVKVIGNTAVVLTDGPKDVIENADQAIFVAGVAPGAPREEERRQFALRALSSVTGVKDMRIERAEPLRIGGMPGFEILANAKDAAGDADVKVIQWLRFGPSAHLRMVAIVRTKDFTDEYGRLRALRDGMEPR
ncbi:hypothetical protein J5J86_00370 [Aquabacter sp. L1I39]|uniref:hypothetical protein n=1 Tax=Aquabacter sp. L1I39 TaxID=2820278 RepID=UPI001AD986BD|nr:hypothetical protein [Aquabacter sp. L1I39]QTL03876.1 hypothetical protein J5J86_00370 [Aquabacter sp. L1I39]